MEFATRSTILLDVPANLKTHVVFDQSAFVKIAVKNVINEGTIGLVLTALMILLFLGNVRATISVLLSIPISCLACFIALDHGRQHNQHDGAGWYGACAVSSDRQLRRRAGEHLPAHGDGRTSRRSSAKRRQRGGACGSGRDLRTSIVFFPVILLVGVSKYLFTALALAVVFACFASYVVAMTVVPLFCAKFIRYRSSTCSLRNTDETADTGSRRGYFRAARKAPWKPLPPDG